MSAQPTTVVSALASALRSEPGRPLVTMYDDATGERVELSVTTFDNWVNKLANLFSAEWDLAPGSQVAVAMPPHWQSMVACVAAWTSGLTVSLEPGDNVEATVAGPSHQDGAVRTGYLLACSLRPMGQRFATPLPAGWLDWAEEVPAQPDLLLLPRTTSARDPGLVTADGTRTQAELVGRGLAAAEVSGLEPGGRLVTDLNPAEPLGLEVALLAPLVTGSSVVLLVNTAQDRRDPIAAQERVTCARWAAEEASRPT